MEVALKLGSVRMNLEGVCSSGEFLHIRIGKYGGISRGGKVLYYVTGHEKGDQFNIFIKCSL